jgi:hypothetical protein
MTNSELDQALKSAGVPERDADYWEDFPRRVLTEARRRAPAGASSRSRWPLRLAWAGGLAAVCVLVGFAVGHWRGQSQAQSTNGLLQNTRVIEEVMAMFPKRVRAVIQDGDGLRVVLADEENVPVSTPLWVKLCRGDECVSLVTFSGHELEIAGQRLTVLGSAKGDVIVLGDRYAWHSDDRHRVGSDLRIQARALELAAAYP